MTASKSRSDPTGREQHPLGRVRAAGVVAALLAALLLWLAGSERIANAVFDGFQRLHPRDLSGMPVQIVEIDPESLRLIGPWPWSRYDLARLTEKIGDAGATAIGFDMFFPEVDRQSPDAFAKRYPELAPAARGAVLALPSLDEDFARVLGRYPTVLARAGVSEGSSDFGEPIYADAAKLPVDAIFTAPLPRSVTGWQRAISSIPAIEETSLGHGLINGTPDADGVIRAVPAVGMLNGAANSGFALELARIASKVEEVRPVVRHDALHAIGLGGRAIPVDRDGRFRLHFGRVRGENITSAADIFRRRFRSGRLAGKVVVISLTGAGTVDVVNTPIEAQTYGVRVQAQAVDAILRGAWLVRPAWARAAEPATGGLLALIAILLFPRLRRAWAFAVPAGVALAVIAVSWLAFDRFDTLLDPLGPLLIGGAAALAVLVAMFVESGIVQRRLQGALVQERVSAARAAGELEAARDIQLGMLPTRASLAALDPLIDIDAILEPARAVGGDFYDAFSLGDGRVAVLIGDVTGKGVPAALFMALSKALARSIILRERDDLAAAAAMLSAELARDNRQDMFVTMLIAIADGRSGELLMVNAGHENPLLVRRDGSVTEHAMEGGPPLCVVDDFPYAMERLTLGAGEGLVFVTDGVTEAQDAAGAFFDRDRAIAVLQDLPGGWRAADATTTILRAVRAFEAGAEASDDLTVLALVRPRASQPG